MIIVEGDRCNENILWNQIYKTQYDTLKFIKFTYKNG